MKAFRIFTAFTGIRFSTDPVHGDGQTLVSFRAQCTKRHTCRGKAPSNFFDRFHLIDRQGRLSGRNNLQQIAQRVRANRFDRVGIGLVVLRLI